MQLMKENEMLRASYEQQVQATLALRSKLQEVIRGGAQKVGDGQLGLFSPTESTLSEYEVLL